MNRDELQFLLKKYNITPRKQQGQNFLIDDSVVEASIEAAKLGENDTVLEIGPGFGSLTIQLAETGAKVVAVEQDQDLAPAIRSLQAQYPNLDLYNEDIRTFNAAEAGLKDLEYKMVANLPYSITSWILKHFLDHAPRPTEMVVLVQKEVAQRIAAAPGQMSVLAVATQVQATAEIVKIVLPDSFIPAPKVDSAVIKITRRPEMLTKDLKAYMRLVKMGFASKRKQLKKTLPGQVGRTSEQIIQLLEQIGLPPTARPQELSVEQWEQLRVALEA